MAGGGEVDGFLVQLPAYDFAAEARLVLHHWQQLAWQGNYRQLLEQDRFDFKQIYYSRNPDLAQQQQALLTVLERQPPSVLRREAQRLATLNLFLPDNQLLLHFIERTGTPRSTSSCGANPWITTAWRRCTPFPASTRARRRAIC